MVFKIKPDTIYFQMGEFIRAEYHETQGILEIECVGVIGNDQEKPVIFLIQPDLASILRTLLNTLETGELGTPPSAHRTLPTTQ